jgi:hypothetical protein
VGEPVAARPRFVEQAEHHGVIEDPRRKLPIPAGNQRQLPQRDLTAVIPLANMANVLVISPAKGIKLR